MSENKIPFDHVCKVSHIDSDGMITHTIQHLVGTSSPWITSTYGPDDPSHNDSSKDSSSDNTSSSTKKTTNHKQE